MFNLADSSQLISIFCVLTYGIALLPKNYAMSSFFEMYIYRFLSIAIIVLGLSILILSNLKNKKKVGD